MATKLGLYNEALRRLQKRTLEVLTDEGEARQAIGRLEGVANSLATLRETLARDVARIETAHSNRLDDHAGRLRKVENRQWWFLGWASLAGALIAAVANYLRGDAP